MDIKYLTNIFSWHAATQHAAQFQGAWIPEKPVSTACPDCFGTGKLYVSLYFGTLYARDYTRPCPRCSAGVIITPKLGIHVDLEGPS